MSQDILRDVILSAGQYLTSTVLKKVLRKLKNVKTYDSTIVQ